MRSEARSEGRTPRDGSRSGLRGMVPAAWPRLGHAGWGSGGPSCSSRSAPSSSASIALGPATAATPTPRPASAPTPTPKATPSEPAGVDPVPSVLATPPTSPTPTVAPSPGPQAGSPPVVEPPVSITRPRLASQTRLALQARLDRLRERYGIPGISVAIVLPDGATWSGTSGFADVADKAPVTRSTSFAIASVSKTFTAALILALAEEGRIDLDAPVRTVPADVQEGLDEGHGPPPARPHERPARLLLPSVDRPAPPVATGPSMGPRDGDEVRRQAVLQSPATAGTTRTPTTSCSGARRDASRRQPLADQVRTRFLEPLGLDTRGISRRTRPPPDVAHGYRFASASTAAPAIDLSDGTPLVPFTSVVTAAGGAGGFASTARDLARWARALYGGEVLGPNTVAAMIDVAQHDRAVRAARPVRPRRPGRRHRWAPDARPFRSAARLSLGGPLAARPGRLDRGAHQPEPAPIPAPSSGAPAQDRADPGRSRLRAAQPAPLAARRARRLGPLAPTPRRSTDGSLVARAREPTVAARLRGQHADPGRRLHDRGDGQWRACARRVTFARSSRHDGDLALERVRWQPLGGKARTQRAMSIAIDDVLIAVADDDPGIAGPRAVARPPPRGRPVRDRGRAADAAGLRPGRALTRPNGEFVLLAMSDRLADRGCGSALDADRPASARQPLRRRARRGRHHARLLLPGRRDDPGRRRGDRRRA